MREENSNFTSKKLLLSSGINRNDISLRTVRRFLNKKGYHYLKTRKKGILSKKDVRKRLKIAFYLDGGEFHTQNKSSGRS